MEALTNLEMACKLLSGIKETGLPEVNPDDFLSKEQVRAVNTLVSFVKDYCQVYECTDAILGEHLPITLYDVIHPVMDEDGFVDNDATVMPVRVLRDGEIYLVHRSMRSINPVNGAPQLNLWI